VTYSVHGPEAASRNRVIGYIRVSTDQQASEGVSLDAQREKIRAYCMALDLELVEICADNGYSAKTIERPGLNEALGRLRSGEADILLVAKLDRLTRSVKDLGQLVDTYFLPGRYSLLSIGDSIDTRTASGRLVLNVLASVAQWEREAISERTSEALRHLKAQGVHIGATAYGAMRLPHPDKNGRRPIVAVAEHAQIITRMQLLRKAGNTLSSICAQLNQEGIPSPRGGQWQPTVVRTILRRANGEPPPTARPLKPRVAKTRDLAIQRATQLRNQEYSLRKIGRILYREGYRPPRGGLWHAAMVADLLRDRTP
jgi:DNA invertase Pin-like site-specific DNA recombinase